MLVMMVLGIAPSLVGQVPITFQYFYDETGQLTRVVDSTGVVIAYVYDAVGNILEVKRTGAPPGELTIFSFAPAQGGPLTTVSIQGQGFSPAPSANTVQFNGVPAQVLSANASNIVATVPIGATTGPISVAVNSNTAVSASSFNVLQVPVITNIAPKFILSSSPPAALQVNGVNLTGSAFTFLPATVPPAITAGAPQIDASGTTATVPISVEAEAQGQYTVVATNAQGSSETFATSGNMLGIINSPESDRDGDGYPDGLEVLLGSDPTDPGSVPEIPPPDVIISKAFAVLNTVNPGTTDPVPQQRIFTLSLLNQINPGTTDPVPQQRFFTFSLLNQINPGTTDPVPQQRISTFSLLNTIEPVPGATFTNTLVQLFSLQNGPQALEGITTTGLRPRSLNIPATVAGRRLAIAGSASPENDGDGDGLPVALELALGSDPFNSDSDSDGLDDGIEFVLKGDPFNAMPEDDDDGDGLSNLEERFRATDAASSDTDGDGLADGDEIFRHNTDPLRADTDGDQFPDGLEVALGSDPLNPGSAPSRDQLYPKVVVGHPFNLNNLAAPRVNPGNQER